VTTPFGAESAPAAAPEPQTSEPTPQGAQPAESAPQAPQGADPRVFEQMQSQLSQFNDVAGQMAEYLPAIQQIAQQQGGQQATEPSVEDLAAQFFGEPAYGDYQDPGLPEGARFDPYTGQPIQQTQQQQPRYDPYTGQPVQQQPQQPALQGDPNQFVGLMRQVVQQEMAPLQREEQQRQWNGLYERFPQMKDERTAPQIADSVARAAWLFASGQDQGTRAADAQRLANDPRFVEMAYLSSVNGNAAQGEVPAGATDGALSIEGPGGASAPGDAQVDEGEAIVSAGRGASGAGSYFR
jgi:hypothetical protein